MNLTQGALNRPIFVFMLFVASILLGGMAYNSMRLELNPDVSFGAVTVTTAYVGASPEDVNQLISKRVEDAVSGVSGVREITATSEEGVSVVVLQLEIGTDLDAAVNDVRSKVDSISALLPKDALKPQVIKFDTTSSPVLNLALSSDKLSSRDLRDLVDNKISDQFAQIQGVVSVGVSGGDQREIQVQLSRDKMLKYGLGIADVAQALANSSLNVPAGHLVNSATDYTVRVMAQFEDPAQIRDMIISISNPSNPNAKSSDVRLGDIANVVDTSIERTDYARLNRHDTIAIALQKARDGNSVDIDNAADKVIAQVRDQYKAQNIRITKIYEEARQINDSLSDLRFALMFGIILVSAIVFIFLHNFRGTLIVALAIPTCIFLSFIGMKALGFTINNMTMLSLSLAIGVLVDDAIVVLENIYRHLRLGEDPRDAALQGRAEIGIAAIAITMADVVVFLPIGFMGGIVGQFFKPLALGFVCAVLFSLLISFTLTPLLASRWYKAGEDLEIPTDKFAVWFERQFGRLELHYRSALEWALQHRYPVFIVGNASLLGVIVFIAGSFSSNAQDALTFKGQSILGILGGISVGISLIVFCVNFYQKISLAHRKQCFVASGVFGLLSGIVSIASQRGSLIGSVVGGFLLCLILSALILNWNLRASRFRFLAFGVLAAAIFGLCSLAGFGIAKWKQGAVFKFQFIPDTDTGQINANIQLPPGSSLSKTQKVVRIVENKFLAIPEMKYVLSTIGEQGAGNFNVANSGSNFAQVSGTLYDKESITDRLPWNHHLEKLRTKTLESVTAALTSSIGKVPGAQISIASNTTGFGSAVQLSFTGDNHALILATAQKVRNALARGVIRGVINPQLSSNAGKPEIQIRPNRLQLADAGLNPVQLASAMQILYQGNNDTKMRVNGREYGVRVMMDLNDRNDPEIMKDVPITVSHGDPLFLGSFATVAMKPGIDKITRRARSEEIQVTADILPGYAAGTINSDIGKWIESSRIVPKGVRFRPQGQADAQARESGGMVVAIILGLILVYMLLASLFDNLLYPLIIQMAQPQALVGALIALMITDKSFNLIGFIGLIALEGLVGKNAILLVDYTNTLRDRGRSRHEALLEAGPTRLRPIMMTTLALILGMLPVALAIGRGSEFRETIGITIVGGISLSTILTLLVIPCSYTIFDDITNFFIKEPRSVAAQIDERKPLDQGGTIREGESLLV